MSRWEKQREYCKSSFYAISVSSCPAAQGLIWDGGCFHLLKCIAKSTLFTACLYIYLPPSSYIAIHHYMWCPFYSVHKEHFHEEHFSFLLSVKGLDITLSPILWMQYCIFGKMAHSATLVSLSQQNSITGTRYTKNKEKEHEYQVDVYLPTSWRLLELKRKTQKKWCSIAHCNSHVFYKAQGSSVAVNSINRNTMWILGTK